MRSIILVFCIALCLSSLNGILNPAQQINVPAASRFAGNEAVAYHQNILYFVYLQNQQDQSLRDLIFAKSIDHGGTFSNILVTTVHDYGIYSNGLSNITTLDQSAPTIEVTDTSVIITYHDLGKLYTALSTDGGRTFTINQIGTGYDPLPLVRDDDGQLFSYNVNHDPAGDSLYSYFAFNYTTENIDLSVDSGRAHFIGTDIMYGPMRFNSDLWVDQLGGGTNQGWPTFWGPVYTTGIIQCSTGAVPYSTIFRGGYYEHVAPLEFDAQKVMTYLDTNSQSFNVPPDPNTISMIKVNGASYTSWVGNIVQNPNPYQLPVYSSYPPPTGPIIATNTVAHIDTVWTVGPSGNLSNGIMKVSTPLWIQGTFSGKQTWYSPYDIKIIGDIKLNGTPLGTSPDGGTNPNNANLTDYVSLIAGGKVMIGYGYLDPIDSLRYFRTCGGDTGNNTGVWIYASIFALGDGVGNPHNDGMFTFEYQHPHLSTPAVRIGGQLYDMNDLHEHIFPPTQANPWPASIDYPWYNPLWPELHPYMERGYVHTYGDIYQRRVGFMHRSTNDPANNNGTWNFANHKYGDASQGINYPGATGSGVGYKKDYHPDNRLKDHTFPFSMSSDGIWLKSSSDLNTWNLINYTISHDKVNAKTLQVVDGQKVLTLNNKMYAANDNSLQQLTVTPSIVGNILRSFTNESLANMLTAKDFNPANPDTLQVISVNLAEGISEVKLSVPTSGKIFDFIANENNRGILATSSPEGIISFYKQNEASQYILAETWTPDLTLQFLAANRELSRMVMIPTVDDSMFVLFFFKPTAVSANGTFYLAKGVMSITGANDDVAPSTTVSLNTYPNPFSHNMKIQIITPKAMAATLQVFNLRGQLIKSISSNEILSKGVYSLSWNGKDDKGQAVASGIYFLKAEIGDKILTRKILKVK